MKFSNLGFYKKDDKVIEGFIGDYVTSLDKVKIAFILREPNSSGEAADKFWFKEIVEHNKDDNPYFSKLGEIACLLLKENNKQEALKNGIYINLNPEKGEKSASQEYRKIYIAFENKDCQNTIAKSRWEIINSLPQGCKIVTVGDIFNAIKSNVKPNSETIQGLAIKSSTIDRCFEAFSFNNAQGNIEVYSIYHPQSYGKNHYNGYEIKLNSKE